MTVEKAIELKPGSHYIVEVDIDRVSIDTIDYIQDRLETAGINVVIAMTHGGKSIRVVPQETVQ